LNRGRRPPRLVIVTDRHATLGRPLLDVVAAAVRGVSGTGVDPADVVVQLREKDLEGRALTELAWGLRGITADAGARLYVNDRLDVALAVHADGVHLGGTSLAIADAARAAPGLAIAVSTHGPADVAAAANSPGVSGKVAFALYGPVHDTPSKRRYGAPLGLASLTEAAGIGVPLIAIGGIAADDVPAVIAAGARGVACIRAVMAAGDPAFSVGTFCKYLSDLG
jgi:thiamine-phosphate pyrophosphorylase